MNTAKKIWIAVIAVVAIIAVIGVGVWLVQRNDSQEAETLTQPTEETTTPDREPTTRSTPGELSTDFLGRRVIDYGTGEGNPLTESLYDTPDMCAGAERVRIPEGAEIQRTHEVMTLWTTSDGPSIITNGLPAGYSRTPAGAALAGANINALLGASSDTLTSVLEDGFLWNEDQKEALSAATDQVAEGFSSPRQGTETIPVPEAFRIVSCAEDLVVVELAQPMNSDLQGPTETYWTVIRLPMVWVNGQWLINSIDSNSTNRGTTQELGGDWVRWDI